MDAETFAFLPAMPEGVTEGMYCADCFDQVVGPELAKYEELMEKARNVNMFYASQSKESRFIRRIERPIHVKGCTDREEAILKLAFIAVQLGKNGLVDVELSSSKIRMEAYQTSIWSGRAVPVQVDEAVLQRRFAGTPN